MNDNKAAVENVAFISYAREDEAFAKQLETEIESYPHPRGAGTAHVFRDRSDFTGSSYENSLDKHLRNSASLIVICSPLARKSPYVGDEIRRFAEIHGGERIFPILVSGLPNNEADDQKAFPEALFDVMKTQGMPLGAEYRGFDSNRERVSGGRFEGEWYKLLANIYGMTPAEIREQDKQRLLSAKAKQLASVASIAVLLLVALGGMVFLWQDANSAKESALASEIKAKNAEAEAQKLRQRAEDAKAEAEKERKRAVELETLASEMSAKAQTELRIVQKQPMEPESTAKPSPLARVYFQIRKVKDNDDSQMKRAKSIQEKLEALNLGLTVPGIESLDVGPTRSSELRYFRKSESGEAERIASAIRSLGENDLAVKYVPGFEESKNIRQHHFELWLKPV